MFNRIPYVMAFKGWHSYEVQVGPIVVQMRHSYIRRHGRFHAFRDPLWRHTVGAR